MVTKKTAAKKATVKKATPKKAAAKKTTAKRAAAKKAAPVRKRAAAKKTTAPRKRAPRKKSQPAKPDVQAVVDQVAEAAAAAGEPEPGYDDGKPAGPVELACRRELEALKLHGTALGASAIQLARLADQTESAAGAATALREMRMTLGAARSLGVPAGNGGNSPEGENVVPPSRLQQMRERHQGGKA